MSAGQGEAEHKGMAATADAFVQFIDVQKSYDGETLVVKNLNLDIAPGRVPDHARPVRVGQDHHA